MLIKQYVRYNIYLHKIQHMITYINTYISEYNIIVIINYIQYLLYTYIILYYIRL